MDVLVAMVSFYIVMGIIVVGLLGPEDPYLEFGIGIFWPLYLLKGVIFLMFVLGRLTIGNSHRWFVIPQSIVKMLKVTTLSLIGRYE